VKLLILGINYAPEKIGIAVYTSDLARSLVQAGHDVRVLTAKPYYPEWQVQRAPSPFLVERNL
jgi:colanic acid biosynthesis glycosyl transferase WcaI